MHLLAIAKYLGTTQLSHQILRQKLKKNSFPHGGGKGYNKQGEKTKLFYFLCSIFLFSYSMS